MVGSGGSAASTFCESLADADAAALKRLLFARISGNMILEYLSKIFIIRQYLKSINAIGEIKNLHTFASNAF